MHLIATGGVKRLAAGAHPVFAQLLPVVPCLVFGFLWALLQPTGDGVGQARDETSVHVKQSFEGPAARDLIAGLIEPISDLTVQMRRPTD
jgi:hypothetical protein